MERVWNLVRFSLRRTCQSLGVRNDKEKEATHGERGILSLWFIRRCSMSAVQKMKQKNWGMKL